jgi:hypothetical protein
MSYHLLVKSLFDTVKKAAHNDDTMDSSRTFFEEANLFGIYLEIFFQNVVAVMSNQ